MCCFSGPVHVHGTRIFGRLDGSGWQALVYEMKYDASNPVAMVLPLPVDRSFGDDAVRFVDLSGYPTFFTDLEAGFADLIDDADGDFGRGRTLSLPVQRVGDFEASFVPTVTDFGRLDRRFRIDATVWRSVPGANDAGFAVFQLRPGRFDTHPMAFGFRTREPSKVFFPTVHIHDGTVPVEARFDHVLYMQARHGQPRGFEAGGSARDHVDIRRAQRLVHSQRTVWRRAIVGVTENADVWAMDG